MAFATSARYWFRSLLVGVGIAVVITVVAAMTPIGASVPATGVLSWALGWVYVVWAMDAGRTPAVAVDLGLAGIILVAGYFLVAVPAGVSALYGIHAVGWWLRRSVRAQDAHTLTTIWISFNTAMAVLVWM